MVKKRLWLLTTLLLFCASAIWAQELAGPGPAGTHEQIRSCAVARSQISVSREATPWQSIGESTDFISLTHSQRNRRPVVAPVELRAELAGAFVNPCVQWMRQCSSWCNAVGCFVEYISCDPDECGCACY
jgi:hypothetical protein